MTCQDAEGIIMEFHEYYPKDRLHEELVSYREPRSMFQWEHEEGTVFEELANRMCWPLSAWEIAMVEAQKIATFHNLVVRQIKRRGKLDRRARRVAAWQMVKASFMAARARDRRL